MVSEQDICSSVLEFVTEGGYPASEKVVAAEFPVSALSEELDLLGKAREQVEVSTAQRPLTLILESLRIPLYVLTHHVV
jgi:hypothetical protein